MTYLAIGGAAFLGYAIWALACEFAAGWLINRISGKVGR